MVYLKRNSIILSLILCFLMIGCGTKQPSKEANMDDQALFHSLQGLTVQNVDGEPVEMDSLWKDRKVVLVFLRHFG